jgi:transglutaminase-like putative cysteine protease
MAGPGLGSAAAGLVAAGLVAAASILPAPAATAGVPDHPAVRVAPAPAWVEATDFDPAERIDSASAASSSVAYPLADFQILVDGDRSAEYSSIATQVLTHAGLGTAAEHEIAFDPEFQTLELHRVRLFRDGAWSDRLDSAQVTIAQRESDFSRRIYDGSLSVLVVLGDVRVGDTVEVAYSLTGFNPVFGGRYSGGVLMAWPSPVAIRRVRILRRPEAPLFVRPFGGVDAKARVGAVGGLVEHEWLLSDVEAVPWEAATPADWEAYPWLQISQFATWSEVVDWALPLYRSPPTSVPAVRQCAAELAASADDPADAVLAAIRWVQDELRYFAIVLGPSSHAPHPPELTLERRFGDCKDKALLLVALLEELGVSAWPALVDTSAGPLVPERQPSPDAFDHVVVVAELAGEERWIDPTISAQGGDLGRLAMPDYGFGLIVRAGETAPVPIPEAQTDPGEVRASYDYRLLDGEDAEVEIVTEFSGFEADGQRYDLADTTIEELQTGYQSFYSTASGRVVPVEPLEVTDDRIANRIVTREHYRLEDWWDPVDGVPTFETLPLLITSLLETEDLAQRRAPLDLPRRTRRFETVTIHTPADWDLASVEAELGEPWFAYRATSRLGAGELTVEHSIEIADRPVEADEIADFNRAVQSLQELVSYSIADEPEIDGADPGPAILAISIVAVAAALICLLVGWLLVRWRLL